MIIDKIPHPASLSGTFAARHFCFLQVAIFVLYIISPQQKDLDFINWLGEKAIPFCLIFTKADKLKPNAAISNVENYQAELLKTWEDLPETYVTSAEKKVGTDEILNFISKTNKFLEENHVNFKG